MKIKDLFTLAALITSLSFILTQRAPGQTFTNLHSFGSTTTDGLQPSGGMVLSGNILYGTTDGGGNSSNGAIFSVHIDGTGYTNLYSFTSGGSNTSGIYTNVDGSNPGSGYVPGGFLVLSGNTLYGTAFLGGPGGQGTVFRVQTDGTSFTNLHSFTALVSNTNMDGANPDGDLILSGNTLYGTAFAGGSASQGTVFRINTDGSSFTNLHNFSKLTLPVGEYFYSTNTDGAEPVGGLVLSGQTLYGTADNGGFEGVGTVFAVSTDGIGFTNLHNFDPNISTNGVYPDGGLVLSGNTLYGPTSSGGQFGNGTLFKINTDGTTFQFIHSFAGGNTNGSGLFTNSDGILPWGGLIVSGNSLYGTADSGGDGGSGTVYAVNTDGTGFVVLYNFTAVSTNSSGFFTNSDGAFPYYALTLSNNTLYGTTPVGGIYGKPYYGNNGSDGTLFSLTLPRPQLTIVHSATNMVLTWPTNFPTFSLQSTTNLVSPVSWINLSSSAVIVNGQNTVTNPITGAQKFYRLNQ
jgi:uncharacterized repeat protein (TIGR03803 family)